MNLHDWIDELSDVLDVETEVDEGLLADLTELAHTNVDVAAGPVTAYLLGYAAGATEAGPDTVERLASRAQGLAEEWDRPVGAPDPDDVDDEVVLDEGSLAAIAVSEDDEVADDELADDGYRRV